MPTYGWRKENILNSNMSDSLKELLIGDLEDNPVAFDPNVTSDDISFSSSKKKYKEFIRRLKKEAPILTQVALESYKIIPINECVRYEMPVIDITPDDLLEKTLLFYEFLGDKELLEEYKKLLSNQEYIKLSKYDANNPLCQNINGRCIINKNAPSFLSFYIHNKLSDYSSFAHETAHYIVETSYMELMNPLVQSYFTEFVAYYIQILNYLFFGSLFDQEEIFKILIHNHIVYVIDLLWQVHLQSILFSSILARPTNNYINRKLRRENYSLNIKEDELDILFTNYDKNILNVNAFLMALDLFVNTTTDLKSGLSTYKEIITSTATSIEELFSRYNIAYPYDNLKNLKSFHEKSLIYPHSS